MEVLVPGDKTGSEQITGTLNLMMTFDKKRRYFH